MGAPPSHATEPHPHDLPEGTQIGRYRIDRVVGRGGMGTVYGAFDEETKREVAVKILHPGQPRALRQRFLAECEAEAKIRHPHVMPVYDRGMFEGDRLYFVMELVYEPITLTDVVDARNKGLLAQQWPRLRHWAATPRLVQEVFVPIATGVDVSNREYGFLHRDLKPDNILIDVRTRRAYLIDFGICHELGSPLEAGKIYGTPRFLSPEQATGKIDPRTDVWGLGALLFYVLAGRPPIDASSPLRREERAVRIAELKKEEAAARASGDASRAAELAARFTALEDPSLRTFEDMLRDARSGRYAPIPENAPVAARAIVAKAMAREPAERYENAAALAADLEAWVGGGRVQALAERDATGAAVAAAQRTLRRHVVTVLWVLLGLALGIPLGAHFLGPVDEGTRLRVTATREDVDRLTEEADALARMEPKSTQAACRWRTLRDGLKRVGRHVAALPPGEDRQLAEAALQRLEARTPVPRLVIEDPKGRPWEAISAPGEDTVRAIVSGGTDIRPGRYWIRMPAERNRIRPPFRVPIVVPVTVGTSDADTHAVQVISMARVPQPMPRGMVFVPATGPDRGEEPQRPFLIGFGEVTCDEYAEWLDELDARERKARLPPRGFEPIPEAPGRYLATPEYEDRPVTGIRPRDAEAFAAWRSEADGVPLRLATKAEWRRAAGGDLPAFDAVLLTDPLHLTDRGNLRPDRGPYGTYRLLTSPPELVRAGDGYAVMAETTGLGVSPGPETFEGGRPVAPDEVVEAGFRLVQDLRR